MVRRRQSSPMVGMWSGARAAALRPGQRNSNPSPTPSRAGCPQVAVDDPFDGIRTAPRPDALFEISLAPVGSGCDDPRGGRLGGFLACGVRLEEFSYDRSDELLANELGVSRRDGLRALQPIRPRHLHDGRDLL